MSAPTVATLLPVAPGPRVRARLAAALRHRRGLLLAAGLAAVADAALTLVGPLAIGWTTQAVVDREPVGALVGPLVLLALAAPAAALTTWAAATLLARLVLPVVGELREEALTAAVGLPIDTVEAGGTGDLVARVSGDAERVGEAAEGALGSFLSAGLAILATLVGLAALDWRFAVAGLLGVPIQAATLRWFLRTARPIYAEGRIAEGRRTAALLTGFGALTTLRALRLGERQRERIEAASAASMDYEFRATRTATRFYGRLNIAEFVGLGAILVVAFLLVRAGGADVGAATAAALFFAGLFGPINTVLASFDVVQQASAGLARLIGVSTVEPPVPAPRAAAPGLTARGVRFGYGDGPDVLHGIDLDVPAGRTLAVVGTTGSGKSTLATLLAGLREPRAGTVAGGPVALVTQETHVFAGTVADNLLLGGGDPERLAEVADAVGWVGPLDAPAGGTAAQAQQLALARVLLLDPPVVVLDEATAEAGSDAARALDRAAERVLAGRTGVVVAHRLSQAAAADAIVVLEDGRITEQGTHEELVAAGGRYADLWRAWLSTG